MAYCSIDTSNLERAVESCVEDAIADHEPDTDYFMSELESMIGSPCGSWETTIDDMLVASFKRILEEGDNYDLFQMIGVAIKETAEAAAEAANEERMTLAVSTALTSERERVAALDAQAFMRELVTQQENIPEV